MLKFFGISNKEKVTVEDTSSIFTVAINKVVDDGFSEIKGFLNNNNNLETNPQISESDLMSFRLIIFVGNIYILNDYFDEKSALILRDKIVENLLSYLDQDSEIAMDLFLNYENYFKEIIDKKIDPTESIAYALFDKYEIIKYQSELLKRKNEPNPILFNELKKLVDHFIWNWKEFLEKCKIRF